MVSPTEWVSSILVVCKKNESLRICLDPKDLNQVIQSEIYPIPTVEKIAMKFSGAQVFTVVDVISAGFLHIPRMKNQLTYHVLIHLLVDIMAENAI